LKIYVANNSQPAIFALQATSNHLKKDSNSYMKKLYDIEITVCPELLDKQRKFLFDLANQYSEVWSEDKMNALDGLINMLDAIDCLVNDQSD
jgi:hypothetical protein